MDYPTVKTFDTNVTNLDSFRKPDKETLKLWNFSLEVDVLLTQAIMDSGMKPEEVAATMANRLRELIKATENPDVLLEFCVRELKK
jgi:hypothetical protein